MGNCSLGVRTTVVPIREYVVLLLGLDDSGKTTLLANLAGEPTENTTPTIGFSSTNVHVHQHNVTFYDLGGNSRVRDIWKNYYSEAYGVVFLVDSSASDRFDEVKDTLQTVMADVKMKGKPVLVFANKQDLREAISEEQLWQRLGLEESSEDNPILAHTVQCTALKSANRGKMDPAIKQGVFWLLNEMKNHYESLYERVSMDVANQRQEEAQKRKERAERVRKLKEERERQKKLAGIIDEDETDDTAQAEVNPFKPIGQAVIETEAREKANRAQNEEITRRLKALENSKVNTESTQDEVDKHDSGRATTEPEIAAVRSGSGAHHEVMAGSSETPTEQGVTTSSGKMNAEPVATATSSSSTNMEPAVMPTGHIIKVEPLEMAVSSSSNNGSSAKKTSTAMATSSNIDVEHKSKGARIGGSRETLKQSCSSKVDHEPVGVAGADSVCDDKTEAVTHTSSVTSGLSSSAESLTDVTPGSTDSPDGSTSNLQKTVLIGPDVTTKIKNRDSHKHKKKSTLLSRMKNRSKTAPSQQTSLMTLDPPKAPTVLGPLRVSPSMSPSTSPTLSHHNHSPFPSHPSTSVSTFNSLPTVPPVSQTLDIEGLPDLPHPRPSLPPILAMGEHHNFTGAILHTEEDVRNIPKGIVMKLSLPPKPSPIQT